MVSEEMRTKVGRELDRIEQRDGVKVLYACESGSRAWGFESADSDFDVRFIYLRPSTWYLSIQDKRDVIEEPIDDELDISGWDLPKALKLFQKSNPPLLEWLQSPVVYRQSGSTAERLRGLLPQSYSPKACLYHYLHMAEGNMRDYLQGEEVWVKKYFYVLRPVLACMWIEQGLGVVPTEFGVLVDRLIDDATLRGSISDLIAKKKQGQELDKGPRIPAISDFLENQIKRISGDNAVAQPPIDSAILDKLFVDLLTETWGNLLA